MADLKRIESLIARARRRIRLQFVLDGVTLGLAVGLFLATVSVALVKSGVVAESQRNLLLALSAIGPVAGVVWAMVRRIDEVGVAAMIDRANGFDDRLATALEFSRAQAADEGTGDALSASARAAQFRKAQLEDTLARLDEVDARKAHQFSAPRDLTAVAIFAAALAVIIAVQFPEELEPPAVTPPPVADVLVPEEDEINTNLDPGLARFRQDQIEELIDQAEKSEDKEAREVAEELRELLEEDQKGALTPEQFNEKLEELAEKLQDNCDGVDAGKLLTALERLSPGFADEEFASEVRDAVDNGKRDKATVQVDDKAAELAEAGTFTAGVDRDSFFAGVDQAVEDHLTCRADELDEVAEALKEAAEAAKLDKAADNKDLGKAAEDAKDLAAALKEGDMDKAAEAMEKIAEKVANDEIDPKELEALASLLEKFADSLDLNDPELAKKFEKYKKLADKLEKKMKQKGSLSKNEQRQLDEAKKNLDRLQREKEQQERGEAARRIKRLTQRTRQAADELRRQKQQKLERQAGDKGEQDQNNADAEKRAGDQGEKEDGENGQSGDKNGEQEKPEMRNAADELRRLKKDQQGEGTKDDLKEATDRLKEDAKRSQGGKGKKKDIGNDERANKIDEFLKQAKGQKGDKPGEGKGKGEGQGGQGDKPGDGKQAGSGQGGDKPGQGDGQNSGGSKPGEGHEDPDGARTADLDSSREDTQVNGQKGGGPSTAETIKKASQQGFASRKYREVYDNYEKAVEEVLEQEKVPPGYRHYVRTYFDFIRPQDR